MSGPSVELHKLADKERALKHKRFFKTGEGEYGHGDIFLGVMTPDIRRIAKESTALSYVKTKRIIQSKYHEERMMGLLILVYKYKSTKDEDVKEKIYQLYISQFKYINNWDLVDVSCPHIVGKHLFKKSRKPLYEWARSEDLWTKRIAMVSNWWLIRNGDLKEVYKISKILLKDEHDLIHKAVGWMLREAGKKDMAQTEAFLKSHCKKMPRVMLGYAIEKFPEPKRQRYLKGLV